MEKNSNKDEEIVNATDKVTPEKQSTHFEQNVLDNTASKKDYNNINSEFKLPEKLKRQNESVESINYGNALENDFYSQSEETSSDEEGMISKIKQTRFLAVQSKSRKQNGSVRRSNNENTPKKGSDFLSHNTTSDEESGASPKVEQFNKTNSKSLHQNGSVAVVNENTPEKYLLPHDMSSDEEDGMISKVEQARLLLAASKTQLNTLYNTPVKQDTNRKRSLERSPVTPVKHRRVELITLASPKTKLLKQI